MRQTLPFWKDAGGGWERSNLAPTRGRQCVSDDVSGMGVTAGDDRRACGVVVLRGATWADRRIAQACKGRKDCGCGVRSLWAAGVSGQNLRDTVGPPRGVDSMGEGKPRVRNICGAKGG